MHHTMVPSDRVEHVAVYGRDGLKLGNIERLMLDKASGTVTYAVIKTGGLLGSHYTDIFAFIVLIIILTLRPSGLLGERVADRA